MATSGLYTHNNANFRYVNRLAVSPENNQLLVAGTRTGLFRSTDGGLNWVQRLGTPHVLDVRFQPQLTSPSEVPQTPGIQCIAGTSGNGVYRSIDSGQTWIPATGLPASPDRVEVAYARSNPSIVYASVAADQRLYKSIDGGASFIRQGGPPAGTSAFWHANALWVDPTNPETVVVGGATLWRTTQGGVEGSWTKVSTLHPDYHVIVQHPDYDGVNNKIVYAGNDGGIYRTTNILDDQVTWTRLNNNLAITQFYGGAGHVGTGKIIGGTQDNGTVRFRPQDGPENWITPYAGDGGVCAADQTDSNYFYSEEPNLKIYRSTDGANTVYPIFSGITDANSQANFVAPFVLDPNNPNTLLAGGASLWRCSNAKAAQPTWVAIKPPVSGAGNINAIVVARGNSNVVWIGYNDGSIYRTANATATPPATPTWIRADSGLPQRMCMRITIPSPQLDPSQVGAEDLQVGSVAYVTFGGFSSDNVWKTTNNGATWNDISGVGGGRLPPAPVRSLVVSPSNPARLYIGTEIGVFSGIFSSADGGMIWSPGAPGISGPANTRVDELFWMGNKLIAATHGRGMFSIGQ